MRAGLITRRSAPREIPGAARSMFGSAEALAESVSSTVPSVGLRTRIESTIDSFFPAAIVPSTISRARGGTAILGPTTTTSTLPATSARAISLATGCP